MKKYRIYLLAILFISFTFSHLQSQDFWVKTNGPFGASINKILIDGSTIYAATKSDGVYRTQNKGEYWEQRITATTPSKPNNATNIQDIIKTESGKIMAACEDIGIAKNSSGTSWSQFISGIGGERTFYSIYQLSNSMIIAGAFEKAIYKSTNEGSTWSAVYEKDLAQTDDVYSIIQANDGSIILGTNKGIIRGNEDVTNWTLVQSGCGKVHDFAISDDGQTIIAGTDKGPYISTTNGTSWNPANSGMGNDKKVLSVAFHPDDYFIAGTQSSGFYFSGQGGIVWTALNVGLESNNIQAVAVNDDGEIFVGTDFSFYYLENTNSTFIPQITGLGLRTVNGFAMLKLRGDVLAATDLGIYRTTNNGDNWEQLNQGLKNLDILSIVVNKDGKLLAGTNGDGLYVSSDEGQNWVKFTDPSMDASVIRTLDTTNVSGESTIFAGTASKGVYATTNAQGTNWQRFYTNDYLEDKNILAFSMGAEGNAFAGTQGDGLHKKAGTGFWQKIPSNVLPTGDVYALAYQEDNQELFIAHQNGIFFTASEGSSMHQTTGSLPGRASSLAVDDRGNLYCGVQNQKVVWTSDDKGENWTELRHNQLDNYVAIALDISGRGYVYAGTENGGCYRSDSSMSNDILVLTVNPDTDTIDAVQGTEIQYDFNVTDLNQGIQVADIKVKSTLDPNWDSTITTDANGDATFKYTIPAEMDDAVIMFSFVATNQSKADSELRELYVDVQRKKIFLDIDPPGKQNRDWLQTVDYTVTATDKNNIPLENMTVYIEDGLLGVNENFTTDANGQITYHITVPDQHTEKLYQVKFYALDQAANYTPSDTSIQEIDVSHNNILFDGPTDVCEYVTYTYKTNYHDDIDYLWTDPINGAVVGPANLDSVKIQWFDEGLGEVKMQQRNRVKDITTSRQCTVTVHAADPTTVDENLGPVCVNESHPLPDGNPSGGTWTGVGVVDGVFYGELGQLGSNSLTYTTTNSWGCLGKAVKEIEVLNKPTAALNMADTVFCGGIFAFDLDEGSPSGGYYTVDEIETTQFDPRAMVPGEHTIAYIYTEASNGCRDTVEQIVTVLEAPDVSLQNMDIEICLSDMDYDLSDKVQVAGTFSGTGVDDVNKIFDASIAGLGTHRIVFETTDTNSFGCTGITFADVNVIDVPATPTITIDQEMVTLSSSSPSNNQWYIETGGIKERIPGATEQDYAPPISGDYYVTVADLATGCESFFSDVYVFSAIQATATINSTQEEPQGPVKPGTDVKFTISTTDIGNLATLQIDRLTFDMSFNGSLLFPKDMDYEDTIDYDNRLRIIHVDESFSDISGGINFDLTFTATVGDASSTDINFSNIHTYRNNEEIESNITFESIIFNVKVKNSGGERLYDSWGTGGEIIQLNPNPAEETVKVSFEMKEEESVSIFLTNINGQIIKEIHDGIVNDSTYSKEISLHGLSPGAYYVIVQTTMGKQAKQLNIIK